MQTLFTQPKENRRWIELGVAESKRNGKGWGRSVKDEEDVSRRRGHRGRLERNCNLPLLTSLTSVALDLKPRPRSV